MKDKEMCMEEFEKRVQVAIKEMIAIGYKPKAFMSMIFESDTITAVKKLLNNKNVSDGYIKLWNKGRLELSMENIVYSGDWGDLFTKEEIEIAEKRLKDYKFLKE
jgi:5-methylcytosine-specific restriction protein A